MSHKQFVTSAVFIFMVGLSSIAYSDWDNDDIKDILKDLKENNEISVSNDIPVMQQVVLTGGIVNYIIDLKIRDCFVVTKSLSNVAPYSCKKIKRGYPLFAPLITW